MSPLPKRLQLFTLPVLMILALILCGCGSSANKKQTAGFEEEAYIDLKQGFSLVIPSTWVRERIPVSSPRHRQKTVEWRITDIGTFQVTIAPNRSHPLQDQLSSFNNDGFTIAQEKSRRIDHPAGQAFHWEGQDSLEHILLRAIKGEKRTFFITCKIALGDYERLLPTLIKVISSFSILPN